jgi:hypothetical protein
MADYNLITNRPSFSFLHQLVLNAGEILVAFVQDKKAEESQYTY